MAIKAFLTYTHFLNNFKYPIPIIMPFLARGWGVKGGCEVRDGEMKASVTQLFNSPQVPMWDTPYYNMGHFTLHFSKKKHAYLKNNNNTKRLRLILGHVLVFAKSERHWRMLYTISLLWLRVNN